MNTVFLDHDIYGEFAKYAHHVEPLEKRGKVTAYPDAQRTDDEKYELLKDADVVAFGFGKISNALLDRLPKLKLLQFMGIGHSNFADMAHCAAKGIPYLNIGDYGSNAVAEYALAMAFALARKIAANDRHMRAGNWQTEGTIGVEISGSTFGVIGVSRIGSKVALKAQALGANVLACDIVESDEIKKAGIPYVSKEELFERSDFVSIHVNFVEATRGLVSRDLISRMKKGAMLINAARAEVADYPALLEALDSGRLGGLALDVFDEEPLEDFGICARENILTSPHVAFNSESALDNLIRMSVESILANYPGENARKG